MKGIGAFFFSIWSSRIIAVPSWSFRADAVACCIIMSICLSSSCFGWQMKNPVNSMEDASVLAPNTLSLGWAVKNFWISGIKSRGEAIVSSVTRAWLQKAVM